jgi:hypothetical protein
MNVSKIRMKTIVYFTFTSLHYAKITIKYKWPSYKVMIVLILLVI